jgi:hypothetical protein
MRGRRCRVNIAVRRRVAVLGLPLSAKSSAGVAGDRHQKPQTPGLPQDDFLVRTGKCSAPVRAAKSCDRRLPRRALLVRRDTGSRRPQPRRCARAWMRSRSEGSKQTEGPAADSLASAPGQPPHAKDRPRIPDPRPALARAYEQASLACRARQGYRGRANVYQFWDERRSVVIHPRPGSW